MTAFASLQLPNNATKVRFQEPFVSESLNLKTSKIIPPGIYDGMAVTVFSDTILSRVLSVAAGTAVVQTMQDFNLTVRTISSTGIDVTGHIDFPALLVLRSNYQISSSIAGLTNTTIRLVREALNDADPQNLNTGDVKLARVTGFPLTGNISSLVPSNRQETGGPLATRNSVIIPSIIGQSVLAVDFVIPVGPLVNTPISVIVSGLTIGRMLHVNFAGALRNPNLAVSNATFALRRDGVNIPVAGLFNFTVGTDASIVFANPSFSVWNQITATTHTFTLAASSSGVTTTLKGIVPDSYDSFLQIISF